MFLLSQLKPLQFCFWFYCYCWLHEATKQKKFKEIYFFLQQKTSNIYGTTNFLSSLQQLGLLLFSVNGYTIPSGFVFIINHKKKSN